MKTRYLKKIMITCLILTVFSANSQENKIKTKVIGLNVAELPALTINLNYDYAIKPYLDFVGNIGYSFNHIYSRDLNFILVPHINCGIVIKNQTGGFVKVGLKLNARKSFEKRNYFFVGINLINSVVYEKADFSGYYSDFEIQAPPNTVIIDDPIKEQIKDVLGIGTQFGYSFKLGDKIQSDLGLQIAFPHKNYKYLFGYRNFIPGIGSKDSHSYWFPTLIFNIKYMIE